MNTLEPLLDSPVDLLLTQRALELAQQRQRWNAVKDFYLPIINALQRCGAEVYDISPEIDVRLIGDGPKLTQFVRIMRTAGFEIQGNRPKPGDTTWNAFFAHPECGMRLWLTFTSSVCRRVKIGTRMVEQDVFETQCGQISIEDEAAPLPAPVEAPQLEEMPF